MRGALVVLLVLVSSVALADPQVITDDNWSLSAGGAQASMFNLSQPSSVAWAIHSVEHAAKGVAVFVCPRDITALALGTRSKRERRRLLSSCDSEVATEVRRQKVLPAGGWGIIVVNSENLLRHAIVHVRIVLNP